MNLIVGHNGLERIGLNSSNGGTGQTGQFHGHMGNSSGLQGTFGSQIPAGLELLYNISAKGSQMNSNFSVGSSEGSSSALIRFLENNKTAKQKYLLIVPSSNTNSASEIIMQTGEAVMPLGGFAGGDKILTLDQFKQLAKNGEIRYVMIGGRTPENSNSDILSWVEQNGKLVSSSEYSSAGNGTTNSNGQDMGGFDGGNSGQLYDLKAYTDSSTTN